MPRNRNFFYMVILVVLSFGLAMSASAQSDHGAIAGTILDSTGGAIQGAEITCSGDLRALYRAARGIKNGAGDGSVVRLCGRGHGQSEAQNDKNYHVEEISITRHLPPPDHQWS